ncbi:MAG: DUF4931 domain-containing protein [candidate division KSB1 bacterium]|jgi:UDPglucose--hexose-1-phosphate uridylyltransferase|nr:DUF4931 domain-containing protein [candidate division KSB1 bacterium]
MNQLRRDPVTGRWVIIVMNELDIDKLVAGNPREKFNHTNCQFCEGQESKTPNEIMAVRDNGSRKDGPEWRIRVIPDKEPVLQIYGDINSRGVGMYDVIDGIGAHEIVIETPRHNETWVDLSESQIAEILEVFQKRIIDLKKDERFRYILVHKNYGEEVGATARHSYSFIIGSPITPKRVKDELMNAWQHYNYKERCLFCDIIHQEIRDKERLIIDDGTFIAFSPFASRRPFEAWILPRRHETFFEQSKDIKPLASVIKQMIYKIHKCLKEPDYYLEIHSGPNLIAGKRRGYWQTLVKDYHWHIEIMPRLKSYTSMETGSGFPINSVPPEEAAKILRSTI